MIKVDPATGSGAAKWRSEFERMPMAFRRVMRAHRIVYMLASDPLDVIGGMVNHFATATSVREVNEIISRCWKPGR